MAKGSNPVPDRMAAVTAQIFGSSTARRLSSSPNTEEKFCPLAFSGLPVAKSKGDTP